MDRFVSLPAVRFKGFVFEGFQRVKVTDEFLFETVEVVISTGNVLCCVYDKNLCMTKVKMVDDTFYVDKELEEVKNILNGRLDGYI